MPIVGGIIILILFGIGIAFMISRAANRRDWEAIARMELYHLSIAIIWVLIIAAVANITCSISCSITNDESPFTSAINYAASVNQQLQSFSNQLYLKAKSIRIESAITIVILETWVSPYAGCENIARTYENFAVILTPFIASMIVQQYALIFISQVAFQFLLPIGIIMRLIPGLKESSAYVIGMAFALYIFLPLTYVVSQKAVEGISIAPISTSSAADCVSVTEIDTILQNIGLLLPQAVFFPALSTIITVAAARAFSEIFKYDFAELRGQ